ncbi:MAG: ABC transporter substrate-binding protein [Chloroflexota bacterium]
MDHQPSLTRRQALTCLGASFLLPLLAACGGGAAVPASSPSAAAKAPAGSTSPAPASASAKPAASASAAAKPAASAAASGTTKPVQKIPFATGSFNLSASASLLAEDKGYLRDAGIELETSLLQSTTQVVDALVGGNVHFGQPFLGGTILAAAKNQPVLQIANFWSRSTIVGVIRKDKLPNGMSSGAFQKLPLNDRVKALKGLKVGISGVGGLVDVNTRFLVKQAGLDPERDLEIVNVANTPALLAAFKQGQISSFQGTPPDPQQSVKSDGGIVYFDGPAGEGPSTLSEQASSGVATTKAWAQQNPEQVRAFGQAIAKASDFLKSNQDEAIQLLQKRFPKIDADVVADSVKILAPAIAPGAQFTAGEIKGAVEFAALGGGLKKDVDSAEGTFWTNRYLK